VFGGGFPLPFPEKSLLGRSQAVRQRILIPPFGGSIPPAPASTKLLSSLCKQLDSRQIFGERLEMELLMLGPESN
jgi:hypothetical protein